MATGSLGSVAQRRRTEEDDKKFQEALDELFGRKVQPVAMPRVQQPGGIDPPGPLALQLMRQPTQQMGQPGPLPMAYNPAAQRLAAMSPDEYMRELQGLANSGRPELMGQLSASFNRTASDQALLAEQRAKRDAIRAEPPDYTEAQERGRSLGRLQAGVREPATPIAQDPELAENIGALRQRLGGDLNVNRLRPGQDTFMVSSPGSGGMSLMMGGRAAAERLSPTSTTRAPQPAGPGRIIGPTSMLPRRREGEAIPAGTYGDLTGYSPEMLDEARARGRRSFRDALAQQRENMTPEQRQQRAFRQDDLAQRREAVQANAQQRASAREMRRQGPMMQALAGGDQFERALEIAAMTPGNPMAPQAGALLAKMREERAEREFRKPGMDAEIAAAGARAARDNAEARQAEWAMGQGMSVGWANQVLANPAMFSLEEQQRAQQILSGAANQAPSQPGTGQPSQPGQAPQPTAIPTGVGGTGPVTEPTSGLLVDPMVLPQLQQLGPSYSTNPEAIGPQIVNLIRRNPWLTSDQQEQLLRSTTGNAHATLSDPTGATSRQQAVDRLREGRLYDTLSSGRSAGWSGWTGMGR